MNPTERTFAELADTLADDTTLDHDSLGTLLTDWTGIDYDSPAGDYALDCFLEAVTDRPAALEMRPGGWTVRISGPTVRGALMGSALGLLLAEIGADQIPAAILAAMLPSMIDIERSTLTRSQDEILLRLRANADTVTGMPVHPDVLYNRLPDDIRSQLSPLDFQDFTDALIRTGYADDAGYGDITLRPAGDRPRIRVQFG